MKLMHKKRLEKILSQIDKDNKDFGQGFQVNIKDPHIITTLLDFIITGITYPYIPSHKRYFVRSLGEDRFDLVEALGKDYICYHPFTYEFKERKIIHTPRK